MLGILERREQEPASALLGGEVRGRRGDRPSEDVVGEHDDAAIAADEPFRQPERLGDPPRPLLIGVEQPLDPVLVAVPEQPQELARMRSSGHERDLGDAGADERLDRIEHHWAVVDRQEVLVRDPGQRMQPRAGAAGEDHALHCASCTTLSTGGTRARHRRSERRRCNPGDPGDARRQPPVVAAHESRRGRSGSTLRPADTGRGRRRRARSPSGRRRRACRSWRRSRAG